jgi:hypothetical protein
VDSRPWHIRDPLALKDLTRQIEEEFPELTVAVRDDTVVLAGNFLLADGGRVVDRYRIELRLPPTYPKGVPVLREMDGRIPRTEDRHMQANGACLFVPDEYCYEHPEGLDAAAFLRGPVLGYLVGQSFVEIGKPWPFPPRSHGADGIVEFYGEKFGSVDRKTVAAYLEIMLGKKIPGHLRCPCGQGRIRDCHRPVLKDLRERIPRQIIHTSLETLRKP